MKQWREHIFDGERRRGQRDLDGRRQFNLALRAGKASTYVPASLSPEDRTTQQKALKTSQDAYDRGEYVDRPSLPSFRSQKSPHVRRAKKMHGIESMADLEGLAASTGCSVSSLQKILRKGKGAYYSSGSRPNQTPDSWAYARLASATTGGKAAKVDLKELRQGGCNDEVIDMALRAGGEREFPWVPYSQAASYLDEAKRARVSTVARGRGGFMDVYRRRKTPSKMRTAVHPKSGQVWGRRRHNFIKRHLAQYRKNPTRRQWLALMMWAFRA